MYLWTKNPVKKHVLFHGVQESHQSYFKYLRLPLCSVSSVDAVCRGDRGGGCSASTSRYRLRSSLVSRLSARLASIDMPFTWYEAPTILAAKLAVVSMSCEILSVSGRRALSQRIFRMRCSACTGNSPLLSMYLTDSSLEYVFLTSM